MIDSYTLFLLIISILLSFVVAFAAAPPLISRMKSAGVSGIDVHKVAKPQIPEMGGYAIYAGFATSLIVATFLGISLELILISLLVVTLSAMVGSLDDVMHLGAKEKPLLGYLAGIPLILAAGRDPYLVVPLVGTLWLHHQLRNGAALRWKGYRESLIHTHAGHGRRVLNPVKIIFCSKEFV